jgi:hypothetical protein
VHELQLERASVQIARAELEHMIESERQRFEHALLERLQPYEAELARTRSALGATAAAHEEAEALARAANQARLEDLAAIGAAAGGGLPAAAGPVADAVQRQRHRLENLERKFAEREQWIAALLGELLRRRWRLRRRKLLPHEAEFLRDRGPGGGRA